METRFDPAKDDANVRVHGISLARAFDMDADMTVVFEDDRFDYGERRFIAIGPIDSRLHVLAYAERAEAIRPISLRPAGRADIRSYRSHRT